MKNGDPFEKMRKPIPLPVTRTKQQARTYYSGISRDLFLGGAETRLREEAIRHLAVNPGERTLEIGIGTGRGMQRIVEVAGSAGRTRRWKRMVGPCRPQR